MPKTIGKKEILAKLRVLPSLPLIVQEVIASFSDTDLDTASLAKKIAQDQGLSARVLRVANSSFYGLSREIGSIQDAVVVLGFDTVRSLVLSAEMARAFPPSHGGLFDRQAYWRRSFRVAAISKMLARRSRQEQQLAFTAGMFHDVGQLVLDVCIPQQFAELLHQQASSGGDLIGIEQSALGFDHAEIGAELTRLWNFPQKIEQAVRGWHQPEREPFVPLAGIVYMAALLESGPGIEDLMARLPETLCARLKMTREDIEACLPQHDQVDDAANLILNS